MLLNDTFTILYVCILVWIWKIVHCLPKLLTLSLLWIVGTIISKVVLTYIINFWINLSVFILKFGISMLIWIIAYEVILIISLIILLKYHYLTSVAVLFNFVFNNVFIAIIVLVLVSILRLFVNIILVSFWKNSFILKELLLNVTCSLISAIFLNNKSSSRSIIHIEIVIIILITRVPVHFSWFIRGKAFCIWMRSILSWLFHNKTVGLNLLMRIFLNIWVKIRKNKRSSCHLFPIFILFIEVHLALFIYNMHIIVILRKALVIDVFFIFWVTLAFITLFHR